ncbi:MAG: nickel-responsive transcriptional regulator NikR [Thaumarchaeota archaeon]|nr:nickel-responsive transcriptional regulator NikR [Nitrososphaerota archaeon]
METTEGVARISTSMSHGLLKRFDEVAEKAGYKDRSKALQTAIRSFITEHEQTSGEDVSTTGALALLYNHETRGIEATMTDIEHHNLNIIASATHIHLDSAHCLKVVVVRGKGSEIRNMEKRLRNLKGVMQVKLSLLRTEASLHHH